MMKIKIRLLRQTDIEACVSIVVQNYSLKYGKLARIELWEMFSSAPVRPVYLVAEQGNEVIGFAGFMQSWMDYHFYSIFWVNVKPNRQGEGIGKKLVREVIERIKKKKTANFVILTTKSPKFYRVSFGFKILATPSNRRSEGSRLMGLNLF